MIDDTAVNSFQLLHEINENVTVKDINTSSVDTSYRLTFTASEVENSTSVYSYFAPLGVSPQVGRSYILSTEASLFCIGREQDTGINIQGCQKDTANSQWQITEYNQLYNVGTGLCLSVAPDVMYSPKQSLRYPDLTTCNNSDINQKFIFDSSNDRIYLQAKPNSCLAIEVSKVQLSNTCANNIDNYNGTANYASSASLHFMPIGTHEDTVVDFNIHDSERKIPLSNLNFQLPNNTTTSLDNLRVSLENNDNNAVNISNWLNVEMTSEYRRIPSLGNLHLETNLVPYGKDVHIMQLKVNRDNLPAGIYKGSVQLTLKHGSTVLQSVPVHVALEVTNKVNTTITSAKVNIKQGSITETQSLTIESGTFNLSLNGYNTSQEVELEFGLDLDGDNILCEEGEPCDRQVTSNNGIVNVDIKQELVN